MKGAQESSGRHHESCTCPDLPRRAGISLKPQHFDCIFAMPPDTGFFEVHAENYLGAGGPPHVYLTRIRQDYALSIHGVGMSIGGMEPLDREHLERIAGLVERYQPQSFSEHLAWSTHEGAYYADLLPLPYDDITLARVSEHVAQVQDRLKRRILIENPSTYLEFAASTMEEVDFLKVLVARTGCGLLLDVNNVHVSATNRNTDARAYIDAFPVEAVGEIHLAGFATDCDAGGAPLLIDAHGSAVDQRVWDLYARTVARTGPCPTLVEWDNDVPGLDVLLAEAAAAETIMSANLDAAPSPAREYA